ncbi:microfibril-associated glycoprotein 4-like isoform X1 [Montipora capricornis]|uniref:microfibril-associated glycoprotein 4-like isoform X1 n=1 Tax=Montipora capricornis TaxID=246305 RepID=UPI0035F1D6F4
MVNEQSIGNHLEANCDNDERPCDLINRNFAFANGAQLNTSANPRQNEDIRLPPAENVHIVIVNRTLLYLAAAIVLVSFCVTTTSFILTVTTIPRSSDCSTFSTVSVASSKVKGFYKDTCDRKNVPVDDSMDLSVGSSGNDGGANSQAGESAYENCAEIYKSGYGKETGVYKIDPDGRGAFDVLCDQETDGGGWTVFQKRQDGTVGFYRGWDAYKRGFGYLKGEFWIGLDKIHRLTTNGNNKLRIDLKLHSEVAYAAYSFFAVQNEADNYKLMVGDYSGTAGDSLEYHRGQGFTTSDRDNDNHITPSVNCAAEYRGGWWYNGCHMSNLNGLYLNGTKLELSSQGMAWHSWKNGFVSVTRTEMKLRPNNW